MTDRHPDKQNGMTIRLTLCERDATDGIGEWSVGIPRTFASDAQIIFSKV